VVSPSDGIGKAVVIIAGAVILVLGKVLWMLGRKR